MSPASIHSTAGTLGGYARRLVQLGHPDLEIVLDGHTDGKIYTTYDALRGRAEITAPHNVRFDEVLITFEGTIRTHVDRMSPQAARSRMTAVHSFLRLTMPIRESDYPQPRIAEAGRTYSFPFNFVIPDQLLPRSCTHDCTADHVRDAHLQLPPSLGERAVSGLDDLAPEMSRVSYAVKVQVVGKGEEDGRHIPLVEGSKKLHVVPAQAEAPPVSIASDDQYVLSKTKSLRKGLLKGKLGKITVEAAQTGALMLPPPAQQSTTPATTVATVNLRFEPHDAASQPPKLGSLTTKIKVLTFFGVKPTKDLPTRNGTHIEFDPARGVYQTSVNVNSRCVESVVWKKETGRKNSASSTSSSDCSDTNQPQPDIRGVYYTATVLVPISLPASKTWVPSFHSCIVSRVYQLDLSLSIYGVGNGLPSTSLNLHVPVQIGAHGSESRRQTLTAAEAAAELAEAEEFLRPRVIEVPSEEHIGNSVLTAPIAATELPPSYEDFASPARQVVSPGRG